ncbi:MAG TPA: DNA methyltransferase [Gemmatimonadaceae bacterium]|nr:DNA methyltransferase [Gemmatimonadaceae bacterium]
MFTLRAAGALLHAAATTDALVPIARALGFESRPVTLDGEGRDSLGLGAGITDARMCIGQGALRALLIAAPGKAERTDLTRLATALCARGPHILWLLLAVDPHSSKAIIAIPTPARRGARVAALIVDRRRVLDSDAETLRMLIAARSADDLATHARYAEIVGRDALSRRFFRKLEACVGDLASSAAAGPEGPRREIALLFASRLLFLAFLESRAWLDGNTAFLGHAFDECMIAGGQFHSRVMLPLFFGTLNTPARRRAPRARRFGRVPFLNGGLFTPTPVERRYRSIRFTDEAFGRFFGELLARYRFTSREETASFEEAAVDPEMLGRTFECLMAADSRRASGAFYTPHALVERVTACGLEAALTPGIGDALVRDLLLGRASRDVSPALLRALGQLRVLDPACGSGAFLVHVLERLTDLRRIAGDDRADDVIRREVLARSIFGVDINPTAVWLCQLRLWLAIVIETPDLSGAAVAPLPNLDRNIRIGDSLAGSAFDTAPAVGSSGLRTMRERYARSTGRRKTNLARLLDREERRLAILTTETELRGVTAARRGLVGVRRGRDLFGARHHATREETAHAASLRQRSAELRRRLRDVRGGGALPFSFRAHFADVAASGGFSLVVGNPPWVRPHNVDPGTREALRRRFVVARSAPWTAGAQAAGAGRGFSSQVDLAAIFTEQSLRLCSREGALSLLVPTKLWRSLSSGGLREMIATGSSILRLEDHADVPATFDAAVYPGLIVATRAPQDSGRDITLSVLHRARQPATWSAPRASLAWDSSTGSPWLLIPPEVRRAFELVRSRGTPVSETPFGRPILGVKCGLNEAFVVRVVGSENGLSHVVASNGRKADVETSILRPTVRGEQVRPWSTVTGDERILWTHDLDGAPLKKLPDGAARWLAAYRRALAARTDARRSVRWWSLFRTEGAVHDMARVVWADIGLAMRATVLRAGDRTVPLNTCYVLRCPGETDALALATVLNSPLATAWLSVIAEPARGGYRRYLGWTMALFPLPARWDECRESLARIGHRAMLGTGSMSMHEALDAVVSAYGLRRRDLDPLMAWTAT